MSTIKISKGLDLNISGAPSNTFDRDKEVLKVAVLGQDFIGLRPEMKVKEGEHVNKGQVLFLDKANPGVCFVSPVHGMVSEINRGMKRILQSVVIRVGPGTEPSYNAFAKDEIIQLDSEQIQAILLQTGLWTSFRTRPYSKIPRIDAKPSSIFISLIDSNPLALNPELVVPEFQDFFEAGLIVLQKLRNTPIHLAKRPNFSLSLSYEHQINWHNFSGVHPVGLVGTHIHFIDPVNQDKQVWHLNYQDVIAIGKLFLTGNLDATRIISLAGPEVKNPRYLKVVLGSSLQELTQDELTDKESCRVISGSILNGAKAVDPCAYLGRYHLQVSVLSEGYQQKLLGWIAPNYDKYSITRTTLGHFRRKKMFDIDTSLNGSKRSMLPIGTYERVMPLDILATPLLRDLIVGDTEEAQALGCLELDEEDLALCTYVCPSKYEYGPLLRAALHKIEQEG